MALCVQNLFDMNMVTASKNIQSPFSRPNLKLKVSVQCKQISLCFSLLRNSMSCFVKSMQAKLYPQNLTKGIELPF